MFDPQYGCTQDALIARYNLPIYMALVHIAEAYQIPLSAINPDDWELLNSVADQLKPRKTEVNTCPLIP